MDDWKWVRIHLGSDTVVVATLYIYLGEFTPSYILHTRAFGTYLLGGYLPCKKTYKVMVFYM
jgi:hypothetical protein